MNALRHGLARAHPEEQKPWDELDDQSSREISERLRQIDRERVKVLEAIELAMTTSASDQVDRAVQGLANLDRYAARAYTRLKRRAG
jgi:hypothetical protein